MRESPPGAGSDGAKEPSSGRAPGEFWIPWAEALRGTYGIDREICRGGVKMPHRETVTEATPISEMMIKMGLSPMPPPRGKMRVPAGELQYLFEV